mmetsp:Transcript_755/g.1224  ORF Transcript_755/g.1224 Transcript_755/m.1224 type:complete len:193 (+) Transcript_755:1128-1706(+)
MNHIGHADVSILRPAPDFKTCGDLIKNGDFDASISKWHDFFAGAVWDPDSGSGKTGALRSTTRRTVAYAISQWLNVNCLQDGDTYDMTLSLKLLDSISGMDYPLDCAVESCPAFGLDSYSFHAESGALPKTVVRTFTSSVSHTKDADGFWKLSGRWQIADDQHLADKIMFRFVVDQPNVQFIVDNIHVTKAK